MRRDTGETMQSPRIPIRASHFSIWRKAVTLAIAEAFAVVMISPGLMRHGHNRGDSTNPGADSVSRSGSTP
jgi:hypothetical protein